MHSASLVLCAALREAHLHQLHARAPRRRRRWRRVRQQQLFQVGLPERNGVAPARVVRHAPAHIHLGGDANDGNAHARVRACLDRSEHVARVARAEAGKKEERLTVSIRRDRRKHARRQLQRVLEARVAAGRQGRRREALDLGLGASAQVREPLRKPFSHQHDAQLAERVLVEEVAHKRLCNPKHHRQAVGAHVLRRRRP
mmetsp:Transcript_15614/g.46064  ORF Transcript_15614/g.46064 Transcript_15614/m.46064 type:complete len:200 (+) Transcript_15614:909-1508(+)